ncbi:uncharacterized protein LOC143363390 [Halictus rubicundus]|uniref:uncharacterized protein LOC143363390 n=1 Tax=Halictus rubicundus TaxID=77578 RepID=UPI004036F00F
MIMLNKKRIDEDFKIEIGGVFIKPTSQLKYLGVTFDDKSFKNHFIETTNKAAIGGNEEALVHDTGSNSYVRRPRVGGCGQHPKKLFNYKEDTENRPIKSCISVQHIKIDERKQQFELEEKILKKERISRMKQAARDGSDLGEIDEVLDGLKIEGENLENDEKVRRCAKTHIRNKMKEATDLVWQKEWNEGCVGRWTHHLMPCIKTWRSRRHGQLDFYCTQMITGHGVFNSFRRRIGKASSNECWYHPGTDDTPHHTLIDCQFWEEERRKMRLEMGLREEEVTPVRLMTETQRQEKCWKAFASYCRTVIRKKEAEERRREKEGIDNPIMRGTQDDLESGDPDRMFDLPWKRRRGVRRKERHEGKVKRKRERKSGKDPSLRIEA